MAKSNNNRKSVEKRKNYKRRKKVYKGLGTSSIFASTIGGFAFYESIIDWQNFKTELESFIVVDESVKLNLLIAMPLLIAVLVFIWVYRKKNAKALEGKVALPLLFGIVILWLIYSVIEATLFAMIGAFVGSLADETIFTPLSKRAGEKAKDDHEVELELRKERNRIRARQQAREEYDLDGSV